MSALGHDAAAHAPASLLAVRVLGPLAMTITMVVTLAQWAVVAGQEAPMVPLMVGVPALTMCGVALFLSASRRRYPWVAAAVGMVAQTFVMLLTTMRTTSGKDLVENLIVALIFAAFTIIIFALMAAPLLIAVSHYARRKHLATGDQLLTAAALWLFLLQAVQASVIRDSFEVFGVVMVLALGVLGMAFLRGRARQAWCRRVERGQVPGLRIRAWDRRDLDEEIPTLDDSPHGDLAIVERVEIGGLPYRSAVVGVPLVMMRTEMELGA